MDELWFYAKSWSPFIVLMAVYLIFLRRPLHRWMLARANAGKKIEGDEDKS